MEHQSLALKAKHAQVVEESNEDEDDDEIFDVDELISQLALFSKNMKFRRRRSPTGTTERKRVCYNCEQASHFSNMCPFEKREDKPKYEEGEKPKLKPNPINLRNKRPMRRDHKGLVGK